MVGQLCRGSVRVPKDSERGSPIAFRDTGSLGGKGVKCVQRDDVGSDPGSGCRGEGELKVGDLTLIGEGCREPLRGNRVLFPRGRMSVGDRDLVGRNKPVEVPDPEDSSTMEVSGYILRTTAQGTLGGRLGLVAVECGVRWGECEGFGCCRGHVPTWGKWG